MMRTHRSWKDFLAGVVASALIFSLAGTALATTGTKTLDVIYKDIKLVVDGVLVTPKDSNGTVVEPFVADGTTYLPVRALGDALGKKVEWDGATNTVYVGTKPGGTNALLDICPPYSKDAVTVYHGDPKKYITIAGKNYTEALCCTWGVSTALFNLDGKYSTLSFQVGAVDGDAEKDTTLYIYLDGNVVNEILVKKEGLPQTVTVPLSGALQLKLETGKEYTYIALFNMTIQ